MVRCPKCKGEFYTITCIKDYDENDEGVIRISKVKCDDCNAKFTIREILAFVRDENCGDYYEE